MPQQKDWFAQFDDAPAPRRPMYGPPAPVDDWFAQFDDATVEPTYRTSNERDATGRSVVSEHGSARLARDAGDIAIGAVKGVGNTFVGLGELVHRIPGVSRATDALYGQEGLSERSFEEGRRVTTPTNTAQRIGFAGEQIGEFFVPGASASRLARVAKSAGTTLAQTGSGAAAGVSGALTAIPGAAIAKRASTLLKGSAEKNVVQALGPTKEWAKLEAKKIAPEVIERGVKGSRAAMLSQAKDQAKRIGEKLDIAYAKAAAAGDMVDAGIVRGAIVLAKDSLHITNAAGAKVVIPSAERAVKTLGKLQTFVDDLGDDIPVEKAVAVKRAWDKVVSKAGLFGPKATSSASDNADAWALREASGAFRDLLNRNPTVAHLNAEYQFWGGLKNVLKETEKRTQGQTGGLFAAGGGGAGVAAGAAITGDVTGAVIGGLALRQLVKTIQSPTWRTSVSAPLKDKLADALASGKTGNVLSALSKITASLPAQVTR